MTRQTIGTIALVLSTIVGCGDDGIGVTHCCDPAQAPQGHDEPPMCCADGSWQANFGDDDPAACGGHGGLGAVCEPTCCDRAQAPEGHDEPPMCCADGSWQANFGDDDPAACDRHGGLGEPCA